MIGADGTVYLQHDNGSANVLERLGNLNTPTDEQIVAAHRAVQMADSTAAALAYIHANATGADGQQTQASMNFAQGTEGIVFAVAGTVSEAPGWTNASRPTLEAPSISLPALDGNYVAAESGGSLLTTEIRNGYTYTLDGLGRTTSIEGDLVSNSAQGRNSLAQLQAGGADRLATDEGGHFIGRRFDGPLDNFNHFAQDMNLNRGAYKSLENSWKRALDNGSSVNVNINPSYTGSSLRPGSLDVTYTIDGVPYQKTFLNRPGG